MRLDASEFEDEIPGLEKSWQDWFLDSESLDSFLTLQSGRSNKILLNSVASAGMSGWVDVQRNLGKNAAFGVQVTGGVLETFSGAALGNQWNIGSTGLVNGIFGTADEIAKALAANNGQGVSARELQKALGKAALGVALGVVSVAVPVVGTVAGLVAGAVTLIVREYQQAKGEANFQVPQNYLPDSGATAAACSKGTANAADMFMMSLIQDAIGANAAVTGTRGIPETTEQVIAAAQLSELTNIFLPDVIPSGKTSPNVTFDTSAKNENLTRGTTKHPRAPGDLYRPIENDAPAREGELYVVRDSCSDTDRVFIRIGVARDLGTTLGFGWLPGRGQFSGPDYWVGKRGPQRGKAAGGPGTEDGSTRELGWPHDVFGLEPNVKPSSWVPASQMFPASSAFMASLERQVMSAPGCFLIAPLEILLYWRQWQSGMQELGERMAWEAGMLPGSVSRAYYLERGPTSYLCQPHGWQTCVNGNINNDPRPRYAQSTFIQGEDAANVDGRRFLAQAAAWKVKRKGRWVVETLPPEDGLEGLQWQDGDPLANYQTLAGNDISYTRKMLVPDRVYAFRDPSGKVTDAGTTGYYGPVVDLVVEPWANSVREMQMWACKTLQVAYVTQHAPAFAADSLLRQEMVARRQQLLNHDARFKLKPADILDNVGPDSYWQALKARGVGKPLGAGSFSAGTPSQGSELEGDKMPTPDIPEPAPPGFTASDEPSSIGPAVAGLGAIGALAILRSILR